MKKNICKGLNKNEDFYFKVLDPLIYYKFKMDTLFIYTSIPAEQPVNFGVVVEQKSIRALDGQQYERMYKANEIQKVIIDSIYTPECDVSY